MMNIRGYKCILFLDKKAMFYNKLKVIHFSSNSLPYLMNYGNIDHNIFNHYFFFFYYSKIIFFPCAAVIKKGSSRLYRHGTGIVRKIYKI